MKLSNLKYKDNSENVCKVNRVTVILNTSLHRRGGQTAENSRIMDFICKLKGSLSLNLAIDPNADMQWTLRSFVRGEPLFLSSRCLGEVLIEVPKT